MRMTKFHRLFNQSFCKARRLLPSADELVQRHVEKVGRLKEPESEFYACTSVAEPKKPNLITAIAAIGTALIIISIIMAIANGTAAEGREIAVCVVFPAVFIPLAIFCRINYTKKMSLYRSSINRAGDILEEAREMTDGGSDGE